MARKTQESKSRLQEFLTKVRHDLDSTVNFWLQHSPDEECGGYYICLGEDGHVYDDTKYTWLLCRQVWMYARLYNEVERFKTDRILQAALHGGKFIESHVRRADGTCKCYLALTRQGQPMKMQRTIFSECFYLMAMSELYRATGTQRYREQALTMMSRIEHWVREDDRGLGREKLGGECAVSSLATPMMMLCLVDQLSTMDPHLAHTYTHLQHWCLDQVKKHIQRDGTVVLETVSCDGQELPGSTGRLTNPGHAIEAGWFLLKLAESRQDKALQTLAIDIFMSQSFQIGWDKQYGGLFSFVDVDGESPVQLEWHMKLWWPHNEALIAFLMAHCATGDPDLLDKFAVVFDYSYNHFADETHGEWFGYLDRCGDVTHRFKGGPWKGCFHVPRCLMMCEKMLEKLIAQQDNSPPPPASQ